MLNDSELFERVRQYARTRNRIVAEHQKLGYGSDGTIWRTSDSAIKAVHRRSNFDVELGSYQRLADAGVDSIDGFAVPRLIDYDERLLIIEMEIVQPPYVLDFGKVYLDEPPSYWSDPQIRNNAYAEWRERFDEHWEKVAGVMFSLERFGIYYVDPRPSNIDTTGLE